MTRLAIAVVCGAIFAAPATAQVYKWTDDEGRVHYSDTPPGDVEATLLPIESADTDLEATLREQVARERELELREQTDADAAEDAEAEAAHRAAVERACVQARERVAMLESARRISRVDADGNRRSYNEEQRAAALAEARQQVTEWCR
ncbi:MAG: DUF4124 domain-containing protein [Gammaproteobacteria bacterium]